MYVDVGARGSNAHINPLHQHHTQTPTPPTQTPKPPKHHETKQVIPRTLAQNCGTNVLRALTQLRAKHASGQEPTWGINGETGALVDMNVRGIDCLD